MAHRSDSDDSELGEGAAHATPSTALARPAPRVLLLHNRYRFEGGEERSVDLQLRALGRAGVECRALERSSVGVSRRRAAQSMLQGGDSPQRIAQAVRELGADVVHAHNLQPLIGPRGLGAARSEGAAVVAHLHNLRLFCAIGVACRDGRPCTRCRGRDTLPGLRLNCRGSRPEAAVYAAALALQQPQVIGAVDRFVAPSAFAAEQLVAMGLPAGSVEVLHHYLPAEAFAGRSHAHEGAYALLAARLSIEKGVDDAIEAAAATGVPLRIAGDGPRRRELEALVERSGAPVELLGRVEPGQVRALLEGAAAVLMPSRYHEFSPYSALEAMGAGVPVVATAAGGLPELIGADACVPMGDTNALAERLADLWADPRGRRKEGDRLIARVRDRHSEQAYVNALRDLYDRVRAG